MPFTLSHAAAALPLRSLLGRAAVFPALVIGCFLPDVPYFLPDPVFEINLHRPPGLLLFGLPCGCLIYWLWQHVLLAPSLALLPGRVALPFAAANAAHARTARGWAIVLSLFAGAVSHIVWDAFTHRHGLVVYACPVLAHPLLQVGAATLRPYTLLQHASTVVGLAWLGRHLRHRLRDAVASAPAPASGPEWSPQRRWFLIVGMALAAAVLAGAIVTTQHVPLTAYNVVCRSISSAAVVAVLYALGWHAMHRPRKSPGSFLE